jgi:hypothetical protein
MSEERNKELENMKGDLKKNQDAIADLQKKNAGIQDRVKILEAHQAELKRTTDGYPKTAADALQKQLDDANRLINTKTPIAESVIKDLKGPITKKIDDFVIVLKAQDDKVTAANKAATQAAEDNDAAVHELQAKQSEFTVLQNQQKTLQANLKDLNALLDQAVKAEARDDFRAMYFYLSDAATQAQGIKIPTPDQYQDTLIKSQSAIDEAGKVVATKKAAFDAATAAAADARKVCDAAHASRQADLLKAISEIPAAPPPAAAGGAGRRGSTSSPDADPDQAPA